MTLLKGDVTHLVFFADHVEFGGMGRFNGVVGCSLDVRFDGTIYSIDIRDPDGSLASPCTTIFPH